MTATALPPGVEAEAKLVRLERLRALRLAVEHDRKLWEPEPHQQPPDWEWELWLLLGGRGSGKTDACAYYFDKYMRWNPGTRGSIISPTLGDGVESCVNGPSGLRFHNPSVAFSIGPGGAHVRWPNGSEAKLFGTFTQQDVERLRAGGNREIVWCEELAAWPRLQEAWEQMEFGLRLGSRPIVIASTTPKPRPLIKKLRDDPATALTTATMDDNPHLPARTRRKLTERYAGTRIGRQELDGELLEDVEGALWTARLIEGARLRGEVPDLTKVGVAVDPSGGDEEGNDEQGVVVAGLGVDGLGYVLADRSCKLTPGGWGKRTVRAWQEHQAGTVIAEVNYGGAMVEHVVRTAARDMGVQGLKVEVISASRGKVQRAEPVAALYEQGRVRHVAIFDELEGQMTRWTPDSGWSPDRMDALVWVLTWLMVETPEPRRMRPARGRRALP